MRTKTVLTLLFFSSTVLSHAQTANFTASVMSGCSPLVVNFQDQSTGNPSNWFWDFGNGATATLQNPSTTYFTPGTYTVTLTVKNAQGSNTLTRTQYITVYGKPAVNFTVSDSAACFPLRAQFTDLSAPSTGTSNTAWLWDFGDGSQSTQQNPLHVYTNTGNYTVNLKVTSDKGCFSVLAKTSYMKVAGGVVSDFTNTQPAVCRPPFNISFSSTSTGPGTLSWFWDFGDGSTSTDPNPVHTYTAPGNYTVAFATTSSNGCSDTMRKSSLLNIQDIKTNFTAPDSICTKSPLQFSNTSSPSPVSSVWNFGDGTTSTDTNAVKSYPLAGSYKVTLYNTYSYCTDSFSRSVKILTRPLANFTANVTSKCQPDLTVNFQDQSQNAVGWLWDFGDGNTSNLQNPVHTYNKYDTFTVKLIVTNASGCTDTLKKTDFIKVSRPIITFPDLPLNGCVPYSTTFGANIVSVDNITSYSWDFGDGTPPSNQVNPSHTYPDQGTYTVRLTITTSTGCTETYSKSAAIRVGRLPSVNFSASPVNSCAFQPVHFTNSTNEGDEWLWLFGDGTTSAEENPSHEYTATGLFDVTLFATNNGCQNAFTIRDYIKVNPPIAKFTYTSNCNNRSEIIFQNQSETDPAFGAITYTWDFGDGTPFSTEVSPVHTYTSLGTYNVTLTVTNGTCAHSIVRSISVIHEQPDFAANTSVACKPSRIDFTVTNINPSYIYSYSWDFGNGTTGSAGSPVANSTYTKSGAYTVTLVTTDIYGCTETIQKTNYIQINGPIANFAAINTAGCKGLSTTFTDLSQSDGFSSVVRWKWDFGDGNIQTFRSGSPVQHIYSSADTFTVKLVVTDRSGCSDSLTRRDLILTTDPKALFTSSDTLSCPGSTVQFTNQSDAISFTSVWNFGDGGSTTTTSPVHAYTQNGTYSVKLKITDRYGCSDSLSKLNYITINQPAASYVVNDSVSSCTPFEVRFTNTSQYYISSLWDLGGGISTLNDPVQFYNAPATYPIRLIVTSAGGCQDTTFGTVHVYDTAGSRVSYSPLEGCKPLTTSLSAFSTVPATYTWDFGDGVLITNDTTELDHVYNFFGKFVPKIILTDPSGCIIPVSGTDTIRIKGATAKFGLDNTFFCDSGLVTFIDSTTFNDPLFAYNWDFGDGTTSHVQNPSHFYSSPGLYTPTLNVQTENACVDTFQVSSPIKIVQSPLISIRGDSIICRNDSLQHFGVFDRVDTSAVQWSWQFPNGNSSGLQNPLLQQYTEAGNFVVRTIATNSSGCKDTATQSLLVHPLPTVDMPSTITMQVGFPISIPATYTSNVTNWAWDPASSVNCSTCPQPIIDPKFDTKYTVSFIDSNGCKNTGEIQIIVICKNANVYIPNTFSPNSDGNNDVFYVRGKGLDRVKSLRIYNRWGEIVFEQQNFPVNNPAYGWNGTFKGHKPVPDVYVYQVEVFCDNSQIIHFEGNVALIQ